MLGWFLRLVLEAAVDRRLGHAVALDELASEDLFCLFDDIQSGLHSSGQNPLEFFELHAAGLLGAEQVLQNGRHQLYDGHLIVVHHLRHIHELKLILVKHLTSSQHHRNPNEGRRSTVKKWPEVTPAVIIVVLEVQSLDRTEAVMVHVLVRVRDALRNTSGAGRKEALHPHVLLEWRSLEAASVPPIEVPQGHLLYVGVAKVLRDEVHPSNRADLDSGPLHLGQKTRKGVAGDEKGAVPSFKENL
mmetsp:Transcript_6400/g.15079  ORF Transcript_6400/g.15079 Transcript_6400/m.15079 type:complete len:245 (+) Transcript_6400:4598-5332(+)